METLAEQLNSRIDQALTRRAAANRRFFGGEAGRIAELCHAMATRFSRGGRLIACGTSAAARSDVRHVAVEFVHPVIVGKRALPAIGLGPEGGPLALQTRLIARPDDMLIAFAGGAEPARERDQEVRDAIEVARKRGCMTLAFGDLGAAWEFLVQKEDQDPFVQQEIVETFYHLLWELVHVFFEHRGLLGGEQEKPSMQMGNSGFLYPFLTDQTYDLGRVIADVRNSVLMKVEEVSELRWSMVEASREALLEAAILLRTTFDAGGSLLVFGNGGSATDAMDAVADFRDPPREWMPRPAIDLTEDAAILTAIANDIGTEAIFSRQIIAHARRGDLVLALTTSGNSRNIIQALAEARRRGVRSIALVGYDGGLILGEQLADQVIIAPSQHIPRIQEAQATAYHLLRELLESVTLAPAVKTDRDMLPIHL